MVESLYVENDKGDLENALQLPDEILKQRVVEVIDISKDRPDNINYQSKHDPSMFRSSKIELGPLEQNWHVSIKYVVFNLSWH